MGRGVWFLAAGLALVIAAVVAGLMVVGGPAQGRADDRDRARFDDLGMIRAVLECHYEETGSFPETLAKADIVTVCRTRFPAPQDLQDPKTGAPYRYSRPDPQTAKFCADFEGKPARLAILAGYEAEGFDTETGCYTLTQE